MKGIMKKSRMVLFLLAMTIIFNVLFSGMCINKTYADSYSYYGYAVDPDGNVYRIGCDSNDVFYFLKNDKPLCSLTSGRKYIDLIGVRMADPEHIVAYVDDNGSQIVKYYNFVTKQLSNGTAIPGEYGNWDNVSYDFAGNKIYLDYTYESSYKIYLKVVYKGNEYKYTADYFTSYSGYQNSIKPGAIGPDGNYYFGYSIIKYKNDNSYSLFKIVKFDINNYTFTDITSTTYTDFSYYNTGYMGSGYANFMWYSYKFPYSIDLTYGISSYMYQIPDLRSGYISLAFSNNITGDVYYYYTDGTGTQSVKAGTINNSSRFSFQVPDKTKTYTVFVWYNNRLLLSKSNITPTQNNVNLSQASGGLTWSNNSIERGKGYVVLSWNPITCASGYKVYVFDGYQYRAFDVGNTTIWDSRVWKIWPDMSWLNSQSNNTITSDVFNHVKGGGNLPDNPNLLYLKTSGTTYDSYSCYWFKVSAYNSYGESVSDPITVTLPNRTDTIAPTGTISINSGASATNSTTVTLTLSAVDTGGSGIAYMRFSNDNSTWSSWETYSATKSWAVTSGSGTKTVYAQFMDVAGNTSITYTDDIILDTTASTGSITINDGATYATSTTLTLTLSASDNIQVSKMKFKVDSGSWSSPISFASPYLLTISSGNGTRTVYVIFIDSAGNESTAYSDSIILDTSVPAISSFNINNNATWAGAGSVTLYIAASDSGTGLSQMSFSNDGSNWSSWEPYNTTKSGWSLTSGNGQKTVYARVKDVAGNISSSASDIINVDATKPVVSSVILNDGVQRTGSTSITVKITASDGGGSGLSKYQLSNDNSVWNDYTVSSTINYIIPAGAGQKDVYVRALDAAGNISDVYKASIYLKDDNDAPHATLLINNGDELTTSTSVVLVVNAYDDLTPIEQLKMRFSNDGQTWSTWEPLAFTRNWTINNVKGIQRVFMQVMDSVGNIATAGDTIAYYSSVAEYKNATSNTEVDTVPPTIKSFSLANGASITNSTTITVSIVATDNSGTDNLTMCFSLDGNSWTSQTAYKMKYTITMNFRTMNFSTGYVTLYVKVIDKAGNYDIKDTSFFYQK